MNEQLVFLFDAATFRSYREKNEMIAKYRAWRDEHAQHSCEDHGFDLGFRQGVMEALEAVKDGTIPGDELLRWIIAAQDELYHR